jgi:hypothetical protein
VCENADGAPKSGKGKSIVRALRITVGYARSDLDFRSPGVVFSLIQWEFSQPLDRLRKIAQRPASVGFLTVNALLKIEILLPGSAKNGRSIAERLRHLYLANDVRVQFLNIFGRNPPLCVVCSAHLMHFVSISELLTDSKAGNEPLSTVPRIPSLSDFCCVLFIRHRIKDRLLRKPRRPSEILTFPNQLQLSLANRSKHFHRLFIRQCSGLDANLHDALGFGPFIP